MSYLSFIFSCSIGIHLGFVLASWVVELNIVSHLQWNMISIYFKASIELLELNAHDVCVCVCVYDSPSVCLCLWVCVCVCVCVSVREKECMFLFACLHECVSFRFSVFDKTCRWELIDGESSSADQIDDFQTHSSPNRFIYLLSQGTPPCP